MQIAASNNLVIDFNNWEQIWNLLDTYPHGLRTYVYVIGEAGGKYVKIGKSNNPGQRLKALQTSHPNKLYLYAFCPETPELNEKLLHSKFIKIRGNGEWFEHTSELRQVTQQIKDKGLASH